MDKRRQIVLNAKKQILDINRLGLESKMYEDVINEAIEQALTMPSVVQQSEQFKCDNGCDWYSVGHQFNGHQQCRKCGKQKAF